MPVFDNRGETWLNEFFRARTSIQYKIEQGQHKARQDQPGDGSQTPADVEVRPRPRATFSRCYIAEFGVEVECAAPRKSVGSERFVLRALASDLLITVSRNKDRPPADFAGCEWARRRG